MKAGDDVENVLLCGKGGINELCIVCCHAVAVCSEELFFFFYIHSDGTVAHYLKNESLK